MVSQASNKELRKCVRQENRDQKDARDFVDEAIKQVKYLIDRKSRGGSIETEQHGREDGTHAARRLFHKRKERSLALL